jgi:hypothetical protein
MAMRTLFESAERRSVGAPVSTAFRNATIRGPPHARAATERDLDSWRLPSLPQVGILVTDLGDQECAAGVRKPASIRKRLVREA